VRVGLTADLKGTGRPAISPATTVWPRVPLGISEHLSNLIQIRLQIIHDLLRQDVRIGQIG